MIWLLTARVRTELVAAAMVATVPMITFAQTTEPVIESPPAAAKEAEANTSPKGNQNDTSVQRPTVPALVEVELQRRFNELRRELLDDRAKLVDWWLVAIAIVLTFFGIVVAIAGFMGFRQFRKIETDAKNSVETVTKHAEAAKRHVEEIERNRKKSDEIVQGMNAKTAADNPEEAQQAVENVRENPEASLVNKAIAHAVSLQQQGKRDEAIEKWRAIAHVAEESDNDLAARAWFSVGYLVPEECPEASISANDRAIHLKPDYAEAYYNRGVSKAALERYDDAITDYDQAIRLKPDFAEAYTNRGNAKGALGRFDDAITDYDEAVRLEPDYAEAYYNRGIAKAELEQYDDAIADYDEAIRLKSDLAAAYHNRGIAKAELERHDDAIADYDEAVRLEPDYAVAYYNRGIAKAELEQYDDAIADYDEAIRLKSDLAAAYHNRGNAKAKLERHDDAITDYDEAVRLEPDYAVAYYNQGNAKDALGRHDDAIADYDEAVRLKADFAAAYHNRGIAKAELGLKDEARRDFETALDLARKAGNADVMAAAEQSLRNLDDAGGS